MLEHKLCTWKYSVVVKISGYGSLDMRCFFFVNSSFVILVSTLISNVCLSSQVVMTSALDAEGREFNPHLEYFFLVVITHIRA